MNCTILQGDALELLRTLPPESVHTCVTSPPYYNLRDYGVEGQIGNEASVEEYLQALVTVFREVRRVLNAAAKGLLFLFLYVMLDLCWIGAECVFEGIVHESRVDGVVLAWLCLLLVREIEQFERKIRGDGR